MDDEIGRQLRALNRLYKKNDELYHALAVRFGIADSTMWIFYALFELGRPCTQKEICAILALSKQTVHSALTGMERDGYIRMEPAPEDRRIRLVTLTAQGEALASRTAGCVIEMERRSLAAMPPMEREQLLQLQEKQFSLLQAQTQALFGGAEKRKEAGAQTPEKHENQDSTV